MKHHISSQMLAGYLIMAVLVLIGGFITISYTHQLHQVTSQVLNENIFNFKVAQELEVALFRMRGFTFNYILDGEEHWIEKLEKGKIECLSWLNEAKKNTFADEEKAVLNTIANLFSQYDSDLKTALLYNQDGRAEEAKVLLVHASRDLFEEIYRQCEVFIAINEHDINKAEMKIAATNQDVRTAMYGLGFGGIALGIILGLFISKSITNPIYELVLKVQGAARGKFIKRVQLDKSTILQVLDSNVDDLIDRINSTQADLENERKRLEQAERLAALGRVSAVVAHEIRNPLTAIKMLIYSLRKDLAANDEKRKDLQVIIKEIDRMEQFVQNFLQFSRPMEPNFEAVNLHEVIGEAVLLLEASFRKAGVTLEEHYEADPGIVYADANQIKQAMMNLLLNAIAALKEGGKICIQTCEQEGNPGNRKQSDLVISVADTGSGISENLKNAIFEPFVSGREGGIGLGLSIAHQIAQQHGGRLEVNNNVEGGATFSIHLPRNGA